MAIIGAYLVGLARLLTSVDPADVEVPARLLEDAWRRDANVLLAGNGGSAATALHLATDLSKGVRAATGRPLRCFTAVDNVGVLTAYGNDVSFEDAFAEQVRDRLGRDDVLVAISVSGNSENLVRAVCAAHVVGARTIGILGSGGGRLKTLCQHHVVVHSADYQLVEDVHMAMAHSFAKHMFSIAKAEVIHEPVECGR